MNITFDKLGPVEGTITIQLEEKDYADQVKKQLKEIAKTRPEKGFRAGHTPAALIQKKYGKAVKYDVINKEVSDKLVDYIKEQNLNVLGNPVPQKNDNFNIDDADFTFTFKVGLAPELKDVVNKDLTVPYYEIKVSDQMIDEQDQNLRRQFGRQIPGEEVEDNSLVKGVITELNADDSAPLEGGIVQETGILSPNYFKDADQKALFMGKKVGDEVIFNPWKASGGNPAELSSMLNIDKDEVESHQGDFEVNIREIIVFRPAELGQEYYDEVFGKDKVHNEEEYRAAIKTMLQQRLAADSNYRFTIDAKDAIMKAEGDVELPADVLKAYLISINDHLNKDNIDAEYEKAKPELEWEIVKGHVAEKLGIKVTEEDLKQTAAMAARQQLAQYGLANPTPEMLDKFVDNILQDAKSREQIANHTANMMFFEAVKKAVTLELKEVERDEFNNLFKNAVIDASIETED